MKKLSMNEMSVLSNEIIKRINDVKYEKIKGKLEKDGDFKKLEKLKKESDELNKKVLEKSKLSSELSLKIRNKYNIGSVYIDNSGEIKVNFNNGSMSIYNEIILNNLNKELNVDELINKIVEKYI
jgi:hypothetical protein